MQDQVGHRLGGEATVATSKRHRHGHVPGHRPVRPLQCRRIHEHGAGEPGLRQCHAAQPSGLGATEHDLQVRMPQTELFLGDGDQPGKVQSQDDPYPR